MIELFFYLGTAKTHSWLS